MNLAFVVGGSYKAFYINHIKSYRDVDILVFQENILYEYDYFNENFGNKLVTTEMLNLSRKLNCVIFAKIKTNMFGVCKDEILFCDGKKVYIFDKDRYIKIYLKEKSIIFSLRKVSVGCTNIFIRLTKNRSEMENFKQKSHTRMFLCDKYGVEYVKFGKIKRKFRKFCYFSLNF